MKYIPIYNRTMKKYIFLFTLLSSVLISIILYSLYNINITKQSIIAGDKFYEIFFSKKDNGSLEGIDSNWKFLADFESAFNCISSSKPADASSIYNKIARNNDAPDVLRELAQYLEVTSLLYNDKEITDDKIINQNRIDNLARSTIYPCSNQEVIAIIKIHNNNIESAVKILLSLLNDQKCPALIKANAHELLKIYGN
ncbi:MAG: hypothetical protein LKM44_02775 [Wolbachia endosymbiont of Meromenopon meropis]|nr:hypothetical protein [Wolbachia endosymbiont of Meromenopon meropis]